MSLQNLKSVASASVLVDGNPAATLRRSQHGIEFRYLDGYVGPAVATTLPLDVGVLITQAGALPPFFSGLLPEGRRLSAIRRAAKTSADDELTLLLAVGGDAIGNVCVVPNGEVEPIATSISAPKLVEVDFEELFASVLSPAIPDRSAIPGAQDKVSGNMISLPVAYRGAQWILKLDPPEFRHLVANEAFFLSAARESGLEAAHAEIIHDAKGRPGLLVRRFDRVRKGSGFRAVAQEDGCQVLGRYPADKYLMSTEVVVRGLAAMTGAPKVAARTLIQQFAFAYVTCNGDAHAKNFSIVRSASDFTVAPLYDAPSTHPYGDTSLALDVNGKTKEDVGREDFVAVAERCGVPAKAAGSALDAICEGTERWLPRLIELPFDRRRVHRLQRACAYRRDRLAGKPAG
jgi:serine/threonine-protein kinase HipA